MCTSWGGAFHHVNFFEPKERPVKNLARMLRYFAQARRLPPLSRAHP